MPWRSLQLLACVAPTAIGACAGSAPSADQADRATAPAPPPPAQQLLPVAGGQFTAGEAFGFERGRADERPAQKTVAPFSLMRFEVTNDQFAAFVRATGHVTDPEKGGKGFVWTTRKWRAVAGADWRHPLGPDSDITGKENHPVVQVSARDALAFCEHHGLRLPGEAEWERAARGDDGRRYPWGNDEPRQDGSDLANFGTVKCCAEDASDGFKYTAPVGSFPRGRGPYGHDDLAGNVWEWTADPFPGKPHTVQLRGGGWGNNPFCLRAAYRHANNTNVGRDHIGIRCAR